MAEQDTAGRSRPEEGEHPAANENESVASKLSQELSNWRQRRTHRRGNQLQRQTEQSNGDFQSESARTIRVRGHETLVVRKSKALPKPTATHDSDR
jgi:hypothetical protein